MSEESAKEKETDAKICIGTGLGVGALGLARAATGAGLCPLCVIITPLLIATGVVRKIQAIRERKDNH